MRALVVGAVESTRVALSALARASGWDVAGVVTLPLELARRHSDFVDLAPDAEEAGAPLIRAANSNAPGFLAELAHIEFDCAFVIGWSQICGPEFRAAAGERVIGYHPAPLPRLRGRAVIPWTILLDEKITASSLFWIDDGVDSGPIIAQRFFHVAPDETAQSLYDTHMRVLGEMLTEVLPRLASGEQIGQPQNERFATSAAKRGPADGIVDWNRPSSEIWRLIRAIGRPYPGAFTHTGEDRLVIWAAEPLRNGVVHHAAAGQIGAFGDGEMTVACGDGHALRITDYERPTERPLRLHSRLGRPS